MAPHESLPADQRAVLQLLLKQGKSYAEIGELLKIDPITVRQRAHAAITVLGPDNSEVGTLRGREIADYLLGQQTASQRAATREFLEDSGPGRAWARSVAGGLRPLGGTLPEVPAEPEELEQAFDALDRRTARKQEVQRSSRRGGMLIFAGLGLVLALGLIWILGGFDGGSDKPAAANDSTATTTSTAPASGGPLLFVASMKPTADAPKAAKGVAGIGVQGQQATLTAGIEATGLAPSPKSGSAYGLWLYSSRSRAAFLGFATPLVKQNGHMQSVLALGADSSKLRAAIGTFSTLLLTFERTKSPKRPGRIILRGALRPVSGDQGGQTQTAPTQTQTAPAGG